MITQKFPHVGWIACIAVLMLLGTEEAYSQCNPPQVQGNWRNADPNTRSITRVKVDYTCNDYRICPAGSPCPPPPPPYEVQLWGKCYPYDCYWGRVSGNSLSSGVVKVFYDQGFAKRTVYIGYSSSYPSSPLWVYIFTDFTSPSRRDYVTFERFTRI